jgi:retron-type reverse transcriptase
MLSQSYIREFSICHTVTQTAERIILGSRPKLQKQLNPFATRSITTVVDRADQDAVVIQTRNLAGQLQTLADSIGHRFLRSESCQRALAYLKGLLKYPASASA